VVLSSAKKQSVKKRSGNDQYDNFAFPHGLQEIHPYRILVKDKKEREKKYVIEIHRYNGFAMVKFYPHHLKNNPKKFQLRGKMLGYELTKRTILAIIYECMLLMRDYLIVNPDEFVGYVGQADDRDNIRKREQAQRCCIYNILTSSVFSDKEKYKISSRRQFKEINLRLIRLKKSKQDGKLTKKQMENYNLFLDVFSKSPALLYQLMTEVTREKTLKSVQARLGKS